MRLSQPAISSMLGAAGVGTGVGVGVGVGVMGAGVNTGVEAGASLWLTFIAAEGRGGSLFELRIKNTSIKAIIIMETIAIIAAGLRLRFGADGSERPHFWQNIASSSFEV